MSLGVRFRYLRSLLKALFRDIHRIRLMSNFVLNTIEVVLFSFGS